MNSPVSHADFIPIRIPRSLVARPPVDFGVRARLRLAAVTICLLVFGVGGWAMTGAGSAAPDEDDRRLQGSLQHTRRMPRLVTADGSDWRRPAWRRRQ